MTKEQFTYYVDLLSSRDMMSNQDVIKGISEHDAILGRMIQIESSAARDTIAYIKKKLEK